MLNKNDVEHINTKQGFKFRRGMARVFRKKTTRDRFAGLAPTYGPVAWVRFLASRAFEIMILRIESPINNILYDRKHQACPGIEGISSQEPLRCCQAGTGGELIAPVGVARIVPRLQRPAAGNVRPPGGSQQLGGRCGGKRSWCRRTWCPPKQVTMGIAGESSDSRAKRYGVAPGMENTGETRPVAKGLTSKAVELLSKMSLDLDMKDERLSLELSLSGPFEPATNPPATDLR